MQRDGRRRGGEGSCKRDIQLTWMDRENPSIMEEGNGDVGRDVNKGSLESVPGRLQINQ